MLLVLFGRVCAEPMNIGLLRKYLIDYYTTGEYLHEVQGVANEAKTYLNQRFPKPTHKKLAMVFDIDDTLLSGYELAHKYNFGPDAKEIDEYYLEAKSPPLLPVVALYQLAQKKGLAVFLITGRETPLLAATEKNLHNVGLNGWKALYTKEGKFASAALYKSKVRKAIEEQGYSIVANIGDQQSDLTGGHAERVFKLPNPFYFVP